MQLFRSKKAKAVLLILVVLVLLLVGALSLRVQEITVTGNEYYTDEEIEEILFSGSWDRNPLVIWLSQRLERYEEIPFVEKYRIRLTGYDSVKVIVYEKSLVGYLEYLGSYLYFDKDGLVVESSTELYGSVPRVTGLNVDYVVLSETLPVEDETVFQELLQITQYLAATSIDWNGEETLLSDLVERIDFDSSDNASCYAGDIIISLGSSDSLEGKLQEMADILPELYGRSGTLYLDTYDETDASPWYIFRDSE